MRLASITEAKVNEPTLHVVAAIGAAIALQLLLSSELAVGSKYAVAGLEVLLLIILIIPNLSTRLKRIFAIGLMGVITLGNLISLGLVINALVAGKSSNGHQLLLSSVAIYLTNIIVFGLLYWELDGTRGDQPDFLFPQAATGPKSWQPTFFDYVYVSITNATAFSPTDTMPLTHRAKILMTVQGLASLATVALVTARAVNILG